MRFPRRAALALVLLVACKEAPPPREFDGAAAFGYVEQQMAFGPRIPGTPGHERMKGWLDSLARARADTVIVQDWEHVTAKGVKLQLRNVIARFNPGASERVLYLAHWDTRPRTDSPLSTDSSGVVPGANDGASGVAVLMGVADALRRQRPTIGVDLLFTDGEDWGSFEDSTETLIGARYYAQHQVPGNTPLYAILFDMVGDKDLQIHPEGNSMLGAPEVVSRVWEIARSLGYAGTFIDSPKHTLTDDHVPLQRVGIRAIDVVDFDYPAWHTKDDTLDKVSAQSLQIVGDVAMAVIRKAGEK
jgi:glutaminyl-peptide cyclotransferase